MILSRKPENWDDFLALLKDIEIPADFLSEKERNQKTENRDPFEGWEE